MYLARSLSYLDGIFALTRISFVDGIPCHHEFSPRRPWRKRVKNSVQRRKNFLLCTCRLEPHRRPRGGKGEDEQEEESCGEGQDEGEERVDYIG